MASNQLYFLVARLRPFVTSTAKKVWKPSGSCVRSTSHLASAKGKGAPTTARLRLGSAGRHHGSTQHTSSLTTRQWRSSSAVGEHWWRGKDCRRGFASTVRSHDVPKQVGMGVSGKALETQEHGDRSTGSLRENIYTIPNLLTVSRLFVTPAIGYLVMHDSHAWAAGLFFYCGVTDHLDGWIARKWNMQSQVGSWLDPAADKFLMMTVVSCLALKGLLPIWLAILILGRDASLLLAAGYYRWASVPAPKTFSRYWDFGLKSAEVHPTTVSKVNTFLQLGFLGATVAMPLAPPQLATAYVQPAMQAAQYLVAGTTAWSGASYAWIKDAVTMTGDNEALKRKQGSIGRTIIGVSFGGVLAASAWWYASEQSPGSDDEAKAA